MMKLDMSWYPITPGRNIRLTYKLLEAAAAADSQGDHHGPGTSAEAAEGNLEGDNIAAVVDRSWT
jgi:hypothetical protein